MIHKILLIMTLMMISTLGFSQTCAVRVLDESGIFAGHTSEVEAEIEGFKDIGADVYVRTIQSFGGSGNLDTYVKQLETTCPNWQTPGGRKGNLILFIHAKQEKAAGIFSGLDFKTPVDANYARIISEHMKPHFKQSDYSGAFIAGMQETHRVVYQHLHPGATSSTTIVNAGHMDKALVSLALIAVAVLLLWGLLKWRSGVRFELVQANIAQHSAIISKQQASNRLMQAEVSITSLKQIKGDEEFQKRVNLLEREYQQAWNKYLQYEPTVISIQPDNFGLNAEQYKQFADGYKEVNKQLDIVEQNLMDLEKMPSSG